MPHRRRGCRATVLRCRRGSPAAICCATSLGMSCARKRRAATRRSTSSRPAPRSGACAARHRRSRSRSPSTPSTNPCAASYLDRQRGYFNGPCVFVLPEGREAEPIEVALEPPPQPSCARAGASRRRSRRTRSTSAASARIAPRDYDELLDHPVEISDFESVEFDAAGVPHRLVIAGRFESDLDRIAADLAQICSAQIEFFGKPAPFDALSVPGPRSRRGRTAASSIARRRA